MEMSTRPPRIVVFDDDAEILELLRDVLEAETGCLVEGHTDWDAGCRLVERARPDLIILDLRFGREPVGWTALEELKADPDTAATPLLVWSAALLTAEQGRLLETYGVPFVQKPFELDALLGTIGSMLDRH